MEPQRTTRRRYRTQEVEVGAAATFGMFNPRVLFETPSLRAARASAERTMQWMTSEIVSRRTG